MMQGDVFLMAMAFGALVAVLVIWPIWTWSLDRVERRTIEWVNQAFDKRQDDESN